MGCSRVKKDSKSPFYALSHSYSGLLRLLRLLQGIILWKETDIFPTTQLSSQLAKIMLMVPFLHSLKVSLCYIHYFHYDHIALAKSRRNSHSLLPRQGPWFLSWDPLVYIHHLDMSLNWEKKEVQWEYFIRSNVEREKVYLEVAQDR